MKQPTIRRRDSLIAGVLSAGSAFVQKFPERAGQTPGVRWKSMNETSADQIEWREFRGNGKSGRLPAQYAGAAVLRLLREPFDAYMTEHGGRPAYAYRLGRTAVMAGFSTDPEKTIFSIDIDNPDHYIVAGGIAKGLLEATVGIVLPGDRKFIVPPDLEVTSQRTFRDKVDPAIFV